MAMSPTCRMWSETTVSVEGSMWWALFGHDSAIFPCSRSRFQPLCRAQKFFDVDRFLEPFKGVCASVRTRTDTALDHDLLLACASCTVCLKATETVRECETSTDVC